MSRWGVAYQGVQAYTGAPGSGKTYSLTSIAVRALRAGHEVFCNAGYGVHDPKSGRRTWEFASMEELFLVPNGGVILIDEAPTLFNARNWKDFPDALLYRLTQVRKDGLKVYYSAIRWGMVEKTLRDVTIWVHHCYRVPLGPLFIRTRWSPEDFDESSGRRRGDSKPKAREIVALRKSIADSYDTGAKVAVPRAIVEKIIAAKKLGFLSPEEALREVLERCRGDVPDDHWLWANMPPVLPEGAPSEAGRPEAVHVLSNGAKTRWEGRK